MKTRKETIDQMKEILDRRYWKYISQYLQVCNDKELQELTAEQHSDNLLDALLDKVVVNGKLVF